MSISYVRVMEYNADFLTTGADIYISLKVVPSNLIGVFNDY